MQGANRQISERRPPNRGNSACIGKAKPANSISNFVHETSRAHLRFRCDPAPWLMAAAPLSVSMVRTYIRKGGHGGDRSKAGLPACYWQEKGGRAAAAAAKAAAKAKELLEEEAAKAAATSRWKQWAKHSDEQQSTSNQLQTV